MDLPVLKYVDILLGLAVVMLIASTVVTALTQLYLNSSFARARYLREGLEELVALLLPSLPMEHKRYVAERLLRHPLAGRANTPLGWLTGYFRNQIRRRFGHRPSLPLVNPADVLEREELLWMLLEWAAGEGPLARQDRMLAAESPEGADRVETVRLAVTNAVRATGIGDPSGVLRKVRLATIEKERVSPELPAHAWRSQAAMESAVSDLAANLHGWFDRTMDRVSEHYSLEAKVMVSAVSLALCIAIQLDSVGLLRRLSRDDQFREAVVARAEQAQKAYEELLGKNENAEALAERKTQAERTAQEAINLLREPKLAVVPAYFAWQGVAQTELAEAALRPGATVKVSAGPAAHEFTIPQTNPVEGFLEALVNSGLPVKAYRETGAIRLVAADPAIPAVQVTPPPTPAGRSWHGLDTLGILSRFPGVFLSWILISLGAPFWYDLLKKLIGFRSLLARKEETARDSRDQAQPAPAPGTSVTAVPAAPLDLQGVPDLIEVVHPTRLRTGRPSTSAPEVETVAKGALVSVVGSVRGESLAKPDGTFVDRWYQTVSGDFLWAGDTDR